MPQPLSRKYPLRKSEVVVACPCLPVEIIAGAKANGGKGADKEFFALGGRYNPLKRLNSDKRIQGNPSFFL
jgi:hypothetical protein